jgi:hypothetical protein
MDRGCDNGRGDAAPVARRREAAPSALARELDAGQPSRARLPAAAAAHSIGIRRFVEWIFMCTSSVLAVGIVMRTYRRQNGERFERQRNERAPRSVMERLTLRKRRRERWSERSSRYAPARQPLVPLPCLPLLCHGARPYFGHPSRVPPFAWKVPLTAAREGQS